MDGNLLIIKTCGDSMVVALDQSNHNSPIEVQFDLKEKYAAISLYSPDYAKEFTTDLPDFLEKWEDQLIYSIHQADVLTKFLAENDLNPKLEIEKEEGDSVFEFEFRGEDYDKLLKLYIQNSDKPLHELRAMGIITGKVTPQEENPVKVPVVTPFMELVKEFRTELLKYDSDDDDMISIEASLWYDLNILLQEHKI